jgi:raffinose/stachyose/melibiose transport system permease protein
MMLPIHASLIPIFVLENKTGLYDTLLGVTLPQVAFSIPISIFIISQFLEEIPFSIIESAKIDGANHYMIFGKIILPLLRPALATVIIYNAVRIWNNFSFPLVFSQSKEIFTIPLGPQAFYGEFSVNVPGILSAICLATLPILIVYYCMQKTIEQGLTGGAVKE